MKNGLLLINLGSPSAPTTAALRRYLAAFLSDKRVIDLPAPLRYLILYAFILPFRPQKSAKAYQSIWHENTSPLIYYSESLKEKLGANIAEDWQVEIAMRYGRPGIDEALEKLADCDKLCILPLYPQYASASTGSSLEKTLQLLAKKAEIPSLKIISEFYQHPAFIRAQAEKIKPYLDKTCHLLLSYHGLPERQLNKAGCKTICQDECPNITADNSFCYRAQCYATTRAIVNHLAIPKEQYSQAFQSRLGKTPWIKPYTDETLIRLAENGIQNLVVACPSFVTDCLETLEEIAIQAKKQWLALGGNSLKLVPCLNDDEAWVDAILEICDIHKD